MMFTLVWKMQQITFREQSVMQRLLLPTTVPCARNRPTNPAKPRWKYRKECWLLCLGKGYGRRGKRALSASGWAASFLSMGLPLGWLRCCSSTLSWANTLGAGQLGKREWDNFSHVPAWLDKHSLGVVLFPQPLSGTGGPEGSDFFPDCHTPAWPWLVTARAQLCLILFPWCSARPTIQRCVLTPPWSRLGGTRSLHHRVPLEQLGVRFKSWVFSTIELRVPLMCLRVTRRETQDGREGTSVCFTN